MAAGDTITGTLTHNQTFRPVSGKSYTLSNFAIKGSGKVQLKNGNDVFNTGLDQANLEFDYRRGYLDCRLLASTPTGSLPDR